jgi:hypothetical protein
VLFAHAGNAPALGADHTLTHPENAFPAEKFTDLNLNFSGSRYFKNFVSRHFDLSS